MLPFRFSKIRMFLMCLMLAGTIMLHRSEESINRYLLVTEGNQNDNHWPNQDRVDAMVNELSQFDPTTVIFPEELKHTFSTKYTTKRLLSLPHKGTDPNPQAHIERMAEGDLRHFLYGCSATSGVEIDTSSTPWIMTSLDLEGNPKTHGGDEFYISYKIDDDAEPAHSPDAIARVVDKADGTYELYFLQSRSPRRNPAPRWWGVGELTVHLLYTCATSLLGPPGKTSWELDGFIDAIWTDAGIPIPSFGRLKTEPRRLPELVTEYDYVYAVGNSLMKNFAWECYNTEQHICKPPINLGSGMRHNIVYSNGLGAPLNSRTVHSHFLPRIERGIQEQKETENLIGAIQEDRSAFILGSCVWDLTAMYDLESYDEYGNGHKFGFYELEDHLEAIRVFISEIKRLHPLRQIYWKGCTANHRQVYDTVPRTPDILASVMYTSLIRGRHLDAAQKEMMRELNVTVIDMFDMTYEMPELHRPGDTKHYNPEMAYYWADYFLPEGDDIATASA